MKKILMLSVLLLCPLLAMSDPLSNIGQKIAEPITKEVLAQNPELISDPEKLQQIVFKRVANELGDHKSEIKDGFHSDCMTTHNDKAFCDCYVDSWFSGDPNMLDVLKNMLEALAEGTPESMAKFTEYAQKIDAEDGAKMKQCQ